MAFANDISACAIQVTESTVTSAGAAAAELAADKKTVNVSTRDDAGALADRPFHITVSC